MKVTAFFHITLVTFFIFFSKAYAYEYKADDASCLQYYGKICSQINVSDYKDCILNPFIRDEKGNIVGVNQPKNQKVVNHILIEDKLNIGCEHYSKSTSYHFNKKVDTKKVNCKAVVDIWSEIRKEAGSNDLKCTAQEPDKIANMNMIGLHCSFVDAEKCTKGNLSEGIDFGESNLEDYEFFIKETTDTHI